MTSVITVDDELFELDLVTTSATTGHTSIDSDIGLPSVISKGPRPADLRIHWRALKQSHATGAKRGRAKDYLRASVLIQGWMADQSGYDERVWPELKASLDRNRDSQRKLFPNE